MKTRAVIRTLTNPERYGPLLVPRNAREYDEAVSHLDKLVDEVGDHPRDPRYRFIETLSVLIEAYDEKQHEMPDVSGPGMVSFLMEQHGLSQSDLPEIGSQGVVSEVLRGRRDLNVRQITKLAKRFRLSPAAFLPRVKANHT